MMDPHTDIPAVEGQSTERQPVAPIESRFMFVDVAALRAKQLRRGALVRTTPSHDTPHKLERIAMDEVRKGLVEYTAPEKKAARDADPLARPASGAGGAPSAPSRTAAARSKGRPPRAVRGARNPARVNHVRLPQRWSRWKWCSWRVS